MHIPTSIFVKILNPIITPIASFFGNRPKIYFEFIDRGYSSAPQQGDIGYEFEWRHELKIINNSNYDAYNLEISEPHARSFDKIDKLGQLNNLEKRKDMVIKTYTKRIVNMVDGNKIRLGELSQFFPPGQVSCRLLLKYENEKG